MSLNFRTNLPQNISLLVSNGNFRILNYLGEFSGVKRLKEEPGSFGEFIESQEI